MAEDRKLHVIDSEERADGDATPAENLARRKLLKMAYLAPAVLGTMLISVDAAAQATSCPPWANPCNPPPPCKPRPPDQPIDAPLAPAARSRRR